MVVTTSGVVGPMVTVITSDYCIADPHGRTPLSHRRKLVSNTRGVPKEGVATRGLKVVTRHELLEHVDVPCLTVVMYVTLTKLI